MQRMGEDAGAEGARNTADPAVVPGLHSWKTVTE